MKKVSLVIVSILLSLCLIEVVLQVLCVARDIMRGRRMGRLSQDPVLGYELKPGWKKGRIRINNLGFRGPDMEVASRQGQYRIVVIGDSLPFGVAIKEEQVFPSLLQSHLNANSASGPKVEVVNAAVGGYNIIQYRELYRTRIRPLRPNHVVLSLCQNDFTADGPYRLDWAAIVRGDFIEEASRAFPDNLILIRKGKIMAERLTKTRSAEDVELRQRAPTFTKGWDFGITALDELIAEIRSDGVGLLVLVFPYRFQLPDKETQSDARLSRFLSERQVEFLDFLGPFRQAHEDLYLEGDQLHFNTEGHRFIAQPLAARLKPAIASGSSAPRKNDQAGR